MTELSARGGITWYRVAVSRESGAPTEFELAATRDAVVMRSPGGGIEMPLLQHPVFPGTAWQVELPLPETVVPTDDPSAQAAASPQQDDGATTDPIPETIDYEILSISDIVVTPKQRYTNVVTVRSFQAGVATQFYHFAAGVGMVKYVTEAAATAPLDSPTRGDGFEFIELAEYAP